MSTFEAIVEKIKPALLPTYLVTRQLYTKAAGSDVNTELSSTSAKPVKELD